MFTRGETQAIAVVTLGGDADAQRIDELTGVGKTRRFYLNYFFPPSCVGEVNSPPPKARCTLHGATLLTRARRADWPHGRPLAPRAGARQPGGARAAAHAACCRRRAPRCTARALLRAPRLTRPHCCGSPNQFPYAIRLESTITESNGSSSMATVCAGCLALQDAGVPVTRPVAGVAMGLVLPDEPGQEAIVLTDILGSEDALGDMDFKVAGARRRASDWLRHLLNCLTCVSMQAPRRASRRSRWTSSARASRWSC